MPDQPETFRCCGGTWASGTGQHTNSCPTQPVEVRLADAQQWRNHYRDLWKETQRRLYEAHGALNVERRLHGEKYGRLSAKFARLKRLYRELARAPRGLSLPVERRLEVGTVVAKVTRSGIVLEED